MLLIFNANIIWHQLILVKNNVEVFACDVPECVQTVISANTKALFIYTYFLINKSSHDHIYYIFILDIEFPLNLVIW